MEMFQATEPLEEISISIPPLQDITINNLYVNSDGEITDGLLAQQTLAGDQKGFELLIQRYDRLIFRFIYHFLGDYDQACDILQQVFLQFYIALPTLQTNLSFKPWLFRVARNYCIDEFRSRQRRLTYSFSEIIASSDENETSPLDMLPDTNPLPEEVAEAHDIQMRIMQAIRTLPCKYRSIVLLRYTARLSFAEIGQVLDMPMTTAKTYFYRARPRLLAALEETL
jgi:RNA polymerase sigma-70 factor (ECF subfamily)